ncbi:hypothetical protein [Marinicellulosiphila megalodicopiae]|uniref:hypothetical protein n=1 Tax=Marinicellulosiphila megalodicopiae TaxID=2724896 RepID=UPI003BAEDFBF
MKSTNALLYYFKGSQIITGEHIIESTDLNNGLFGRKKGFALVTNLRVFIYPTGNANKETIIECKHITNLFFQQKKNIHLIQLEYRGRLIEIATKDKKASLEFLHAIEIYRQNKLSTTLPAHQQTKLKAMIKLWQSSTLNDAQYDKERNLILNCA